MNETKPNAQNTENTRLPCRGCLPTCINYDTCKGMPWRSDMPAPQK